jgi:hypothetical protein
MNQANLAKLAEIADEIGAAHAALSKAIDRAILTVHYGPQGGDPETDINFNTGLLIGFATRLHTTIREANNDQ